MHRKHSVGVSIAFVLRIAMGLKPRSRRPDARSVLASYLNEWALSILTELRY